jgi:hypothetical protein
MPETGGEWQQINATVYETDDFSFSVRSHKPGRAEEIAAQIVHNHRVVPLLMAALADMTQRFEACAVHAGNDIEFVKEATKDAHAILNAARVGGGMKGP